MPLKTSRIEIPVSIFFAIQNIHKIIFGVNVHCNHFNLAICSRIMFHLEQSSIF